ncbi:MAG TPA: hypothetical protein VD834_11025 [Blastococcus sp.]|nr:hypothetical protein [Blastococcus sp.]
MAQRTPSNDAFLAAARQMLDLHPADEEGRMLQAPGLRTHGRFYGFAYADALMVKLPAARVAELIAAGRGQPCSPRAGRPMREWVRIPGPGEDECFSYLVEARAFVSGAATAAQAPLAEPPRRRR